ncbi:hypothetical protein ACTFIV_008702 [Dictyostelium citrinum]
MATIMDFLLSQGLNVPIGYSSMAGQSTIPIDNSSRNVDFLPEVDITETKDCLIFECELAGVLKEDISIEIAESKLIIKGDKKRYAYRRPNQSWSYDDKNQGSNVGSSQSKVSELSSGSSEQWQHSGDPSVDSQSKNVESNSNMQYKQDPDVQQQPKSQVGNLPESIAKDSGPNEDNLPSQPIQSDINSASSEQRNAPTENQSSGVNDQSMQQNPSSQQWSDLQQQQQPFQQSQSKPSSNLNDPLQNSESNVNQPSSLQGSDINQSNVNKPSSQTVDQQTSNVGGESNNNQGSSQSVEQRPSNIEQQSSRLPQQQGQQRSNIDGVDQPSSKFSEQRQSNFEQSSQLPQHQQEQLRSNLNEPSMQQEGPNVNQPPSEVCSGPSVSETRKQFEENSLGEQQRQQQPQESGSLHKDEKKPSSSVSQTAQLFETNIGEQQNQDKPEEKKFDSDVIRSSEPTSIQASDENKDWSQQQSKEISPPEDSVKQSGVVQQPMEIQHQMDTGTQKFSQSAQQQTQQRQQDFEERKYISERTFGHFKRTMDLSKMLYRLNLREGVDTHFVNGLLIIKFDKKPFEPSIKIPVH